MAENKQPCLQRAGRRNNCACGAPAASHSMGNSVSPLLLQVVSGHCWRFGSAWAPFPGIVSTCQCRVGLSCAFEALRELESFAVLSSSSHITRVLSGPCWVSQAKPSLSCADVRRPFLHCSDCSAILTPLRGTPAAALDVSCVAGWVCRNC